MLKLLLFQISMLYPRNNIILLNISLSLSLWVDSGWILSVLRSHMKIGFGIAHQTLEWT